MGDKNIVLQHFVLTRFNLLLWNRDKEGNRVRTNKWLEHRFSLFEKYCLPSLKGQTNQNFEWIILFDSSTPERFKAIIREYQNECPQMIPVFVNPENGRNFAKIFREEIVKRLKTKRVLSTYLDNDDALNVRMVENLQSWALSVSDDTFCYYDDGYQFYTDHKYLMKINHPRNHFVSYVEKGDPATLNGVFGFGGHYFIYKIRGVKIDHVRNLPMWCEVIHEKNMQNDAYSLGAKMVKDENCLRRDFMINETVKYGIGIYIGRFLPRYIKTFGWRAKRYLLRRSCL